ncbi:putative ribonuclease H-like domain-containing protein [Tanacetum coccineum]
MDLETTQTNAAAKLPLLKQGEYEMWRLRIEQYFQIQDYALWDVIENGNSFKPTARTTTNADGTSTSMIPGAVTTEEKTQKKNDVKARSMLLMALPNEHLLTFNQYKDAKTLFDAIQTRFGGNDATKKTQKTLLKQMYENFNAPSTESLDSIFNRLQKIVSQLAILGENISQEDLNLKFLRSLPSEWNTHVVVWRNKPDLDSMSFDDLYNNFKIVEQEVKRTATSSTSSSSQNMAFVSSPSSINEVNTANVQVSTASPSVSTYSTQDSTANLSDATVYAFLANQPNGSQLVHEDLEQIHEDDLEEMDLKWQLALLSMRARRYYQRTGKKITINGSDTAGYDKSKVECFNCHKMGHFARECRSLARECKSPRNQESMPRIHDNGNRNQDISRRTVNVEETSSKAMVAIDGASFDWSFMAKEEVTTNMALMAFSDSEFNLATYKRGLTSVEEQLVFYKKNEVMFSDQIAVLKRDASFKDSEIIALKRSQISNNSRKGVGYNAVPPPLIGLFAPPTIDLSNSGLEEFQQHEFKDYRPKASKSVCVDTYNEVKKTLDTPLVEERSRTLIEAARTKLADSKLPTTFWALKAVNIGLYVQNRVIKVNPHNKTPYELFRGRTPALSFMRPFGCYVTILNSLDHLGKFDGKSDDGFFVGYSLTSKAFRVYNIRTRKVEENLNIRFLENKPTITGAGPKWLFDIDSLTKSMNYVLVVAEMDMSNLTTSYQVPITPNTRIHKDHSLDHVIGDIQSSVQTRGMIKNTNEHGFISAVYEWKIHEDLHTYLFSCFLSQEEPKLIAKALKIKAIRLFLAYASFMGFMVYQMDVKSAFLYGTIEEEDTYVVEILRKFGFTDVRTASTPMDTEKLLIKDSDGDDVDVHLYRSMTRSLMYLTSSRPYIMYLKGQTKLGLWYPRNSPFYLVAYSDSDYAGASLDRKSTTGGCQFLGLGILSIWQIKKGQDTKIPQSSGPPEKVGDEAVHKELGDRMERAATTASSLEAKQDSGKVNTVGLKVSTARLKLVLFWQTASASTLENGDIEITTTINGKVKVVSEASIRRHLKLEDSDGISTLPTIDIFMQLALMGVRYYRETEVPQPSSPTQTHVADEATSVGVDDRHGGAATTVSRLEVGQGSDRVAVLENDLKQTKKTYGAAFTKLIKKVKTLEKTIKSSKARRRAQFVVSDDEEEDSFNQGRKIAEIDEDPDISLVQQMIHHDAQTQGRQEYDLEPNFEFTTPEEVYTAGAEVSTAAESLVYIRRSAAKRKDKGKAIVEESEPTQTKTKIQQEQERLGFEEAQRLQE